MRNILGAGTEILAKGDEKDDGGMPSIKPDYDFFPFMDKIQNAVGGVLGLVFVLAVGAFAIGGIVIIVAKVSDSNRMSDKSIGILAWIVGIAALVGIAAPIIGFATGALEW